MALSGRLVTDGEGHLYIHPTDDQGEEIRALHLVDQDGNPTDELVPDLVEIVWDPDSSSYIPASGKSHNEIHEQNVLSMNATTGPLYDADGNLVVEGDPHHTSPSPTDPHAEGVVTDPDEVAKTITSHTDAYTGGQ